MGKIKLLQRCIKPPLPQNIVGGAGKIKQNIMMNDEYGKSIIEKFLDKQECITMLRWHLNAHSCEFSVVKIEAHGILLKTEEFLEITATYIEGVYGHYQLER